MSCEYEYKNLSSEADSQINPMLNAMAAAGWELISDDLATMRFLFQRETRAAGTDDGVKVLGDFTSS
jgi:hypothetical protein